jgi:hypothetical protein
MPWQRLVKFKFNRNEWDRIVLHEQLSKHDTCIEEEEEEAPWFQSASLSDPKRQDGEHDTNCEA